MIHDEKEQGNEVAEPWQGFTVDVQVGLSDSSSVEGSDGIWDGIDNWEWGSNGKTELGPGWAGVHANNDWQKMAWATEIPKLDWDMVYPSFEGGQDRFINCWLPL